MVGKSSLAKIALLVGALLLVRHFYLTKDSSGGDEVLMQRLEDERRACLWRKGLETGRVLGDRQSFSTFNCPVGQEAYPHDLCTAHLLYLNHTARSFVARTPAAETGRLGATIVTTTRQRYSTVYALPVSLSLSQSQPGADLLPLACESHFSPSPRLHRLFRRSFCLHSRCVQLSGRPLLPTPHGNLHPSVLPHDVEKTLWSHHFPWI